MKTQGNGPSKEAGNQSSSSGSTAFLPGCTSSLRPTITLALGCLVTSQDTAALSSCCRVPRESSDHRVAHNPNEGYLVKQ
jgi:hypothetical protein